MVKTNNAYEAKQLDEDETEFAAVLSKLKSKHDVHTLLTGKSRQVNSKIMSDT